MEDKMKISLEKLNQICEKVGLKAVKKSQKVPKGYHVIETDKILKEVMDDLCFSLDYVRHDDYANAYDNYSIKVNLVA